VTSMMQFEDDVVAGDMPEPQERSAEKAAPRRYRSHRLDTPSHPGGWCNHSCDAIGRGSEA
jgi:cellulase/cellobiase CelA1